MAIIMPFVLLVRLAGVPAIEQAASPIHGYGMVHGLLDLQGLSTPSKRHKSAVITDSTRSHPAVIYGQEWGTRSSGQRGVAPLGTAKSDA